MSGFNWRGACSASSAASWSTACCKCVAMREPAWQSAAALVKRVCVLHPPGRPLPCSCTHAIATVVAVQQRCGVPACSMHASVYLIVRIQLLLEISCDYHRSHTGSRSMHPIPP